MSQANGWNSAGENAAGGADLLVAATISLAGHIIHLQGFCGAAYRAGSIPDPPAEHCRTQGVAGNSGRIRQGVGNGGAARYYRPGAGSGRRHISIQDDAVRIDAKALI